MNINLSYDMALPMFCRLAGLEIDKGQEYSCLCQNAFYEITPLLKNTQLSDGSRERVLFLIAATAYEKYVLLTLSRDTTVSMKLLDASVTADPASALSSAHRLKSDAMSACSDLLNCPFSVFSAI